MKIKEGDFVATAAEWAQAFRKAREAAEASAEMCGELRAELENKLVHISNLGTHIEDIDNERKELVSLLRELRQKHSK